MRNTQRIQWIALVAMLLNGACFAQASDISIPSTILGGTVISIPHRGHLVFDNYSMLKAVTH
jgi:hypothetical protein